LPAQLTKEYKNTMESLENDENCVCGSIANPSLKPMGIPLCQNCYDITIKAIEQAKKKKPKYTVDIDQILDNMYLGNITASKDQETLISRGITHILVCADDLKCYYPEKYEYLKLPLKDVPDQDLFPHFPAAINFIEKSKVILVHCAAGASRSPSIVISYLMFKNRWKYAEAYDFVHKKRSRVSPNTGFIDQLKVLEELIETNEFKVEKEIENKVESVSQV